MTLAAAATLLQTALLLLTLAQNPSLPQSLRDNANSTATYAIQQANLAITQHKAGGTATVCHNGDDYYDGGEDSDTVIYSGRRAEFYITQKDEKTYEFRDTVACRAGTDTVVNIERFQFADGLYTKETLIPDQIGTLTMSQYNATTVLSALETARKKGRDARRIADIKQLQLALELYQDAHGKYPGSFSTLTPYVAEVPKDPTTGQSYLYAAYPGAGECAQGYHIGARLESIDNAALQSDADAQFGSVCTGGPDFSGADPVYDVKW